MALQPVIQTFFVASPRHWNMEGGKLKPMTTKSFLQLFSVLFGQLWSFFGVWSAVLTRCWRAENWVYLFDLNVFCALYSVARV